MFIITYLASNYLTLLLVLTSIVSGASVIVKAIAPLTKNTTDDKAASYLTKIHKFLSKVAINPKLDKE